MNTSYDHVNRAAHYIRRVQHYNTIYKYLHIISEFELAQLHKGNITLLFFYFFIMSKTYKLVFLDPHVRVAGRIENVKMARDRIMQSLDTRVSYNAILTTLK